MDIAALSVAVSEINVQQSASISVMKMAMNAGENTAAQMVEMMESVAVAIDPNLGQYIDIQV